MRGHLQIWSFCLIRLQIWSFCLIRLQIWSFSSAGQNQAGPELQEGVHQTCIKVSQNIFCNDSLNYFARVTNIYFLRSLKLQGAQCWFSGNVDNLKLMEQSHHVSTWCSVKTLQIWRWLGPHIFFWREPRLWPGGSQIILNVQSNVLKQRAQLELNFANCWPHFLVEMANPEGSRLRRLQDKLQVIFKFWLFCVHLSCDYFVFIILNYFVFISHWNS